jgi:copper chaperone CopZ
MFLLKLTGMVGHNCERHLTAAIRSQDAIARIEIQREEQWVYIESKIPLEKIKRAINDVGYTVLSVEERP